MQSRSAIARRARGRRGRGSARCTPSSPTSSQVRERRRVLVPRGRSARRPARARIRGSAAVVLERDPSGQRVGRRRCDSVRRRTRRAGSRAGSTRTFAAKRCPPWCDESQSSSVGEVIRRAPDRPRFHAARSRHRASRARRRARAARRRLRPPSRGRRRRARPSAQLESPHMRLPAPTRVDDERKPPRSPRSPGTTNEEEPRRGRPLASHSAILAEAASDRRARRIGHVARPRSRAPRRGASVERRRGRGERLAGELGHVRAATASLTRAAITQTTSAARDLLPRARRRARRRRRRDARRSRSPSSSPRRRR